MSKATPYVIVGASLAGAKAAEALRAAGFDGPVVLIGAESELPYERPPLSKGYLQGKAERDAIYVHSMQWYQEADVELRLGTTVTAIDRAAHEVVLADGSRIGYAKLLLTTGSSPRRLPVPGADFDGVHYLRSVGDSDQIKAVLGSAASVAVIGAGWIGLEVTAAAREAGVAVTVLEAAELPLLRVLGPEVAKVFAALHRDHGVDLRFGVQVAEITGKDGRAEGVRLGDGSLVAADAVIVGVGITPNTELAAAAGLEIDNGIKVDAQLRSSDPDIYAAGDVASAFHPVIGKHIRVEHWANALNQPQAAATGNGGPAGELRPGALFLQRPVRPRHGVLRATSNPADTMRWSFAATLPAASSSRSGSRDGGRVLAGMNVNVWDVTDAIQALVSSGRPVDKAALSDPGTSLDSVISADPGTGGQ